MPDTSAETIYWETVLTPHRSLPAVGFAALMLGLSVLGFVAGVVFVLVGAWPVCGFFGLDVLLVYLAFRLSYRSGRALEALRLVDDEFIVERTSVRGELRRWQFPAFWLRVQLIENGDNNRLLLASHGRTLAIGGFLGPHERSALAGQLRLVLADWKNAPA